MTVSAQTPVNSSTGNGVTVVFPYTFKIIAAADLEVTVDGVIKTLNTDYTVSGAGDDAGGNVTFITAPASGTIVLRRRNMALVRAADYQDQGDLRADVLNPDQDAPVLMAQQLQEQVDRSLRGPAGETFATLPAASERASTYLGFDAEGAPALLAGGASGIPVSAFMATVLDDADAAAARGTLGAVGAEELADPAGAGLVGFDSGETYPVGSVGADLMTPRPVARGGTGASTPAAALSNLGVVNVGGETTINGTTAIANAFPAAYLITDAGVPADYVVTLPAAAAVGSIVYFRVAHTATKAYTLYDGGTTMDGLDRRILWAGESAMLMKTAAGWTKIGGQSIPMRGVLLRTASTALTGGIWNAVSFNVASQDSKGLNLCFDGSGSRFVAKRASTFRFSFSLSVSGLTAGDDVFAGFDLGGTGSLFSPAGALAAEQSQTGQTRISLNGSTVQIMTLNQSMFVGLRPDSACTLEYAANVVPIAMAYEEIVTW